MDLELPYANTLLAAPIHPYKAEETELKIKPITLKVEEVPAKRFKEKTITSLDLGNESVSGTFKKRSFGNAKRNMRQRTEDD